MTLVGQAGAHTSPRMTLIALWLPALPPAPTSMVRKSVTTRWSRRRRWYESSTKLDMLCSISKPSSQRLGCMDENAWVLMC